MSKLMLQSVFAACEATSTQDSGEKSAAVAFETMWQLSRRSTTAMKVAPGTFKRGVTTRLLYIWPYVCLVFDTSKGPDLFAGQDLTTSLQSNQPV